jgi:lysophospholipase L1-like esterase
VATDALNRSSSCTFAVTVNAPPRLRLSRFMAYGDSVTAGQVIVPGTDNVQLAPAQAPYPEVLSQLLVARYVGQAISVFNAGRPVEKAQSASGRFVAAFNAASPQAVIVLEGYNDLLYADPVEGIPAMELGVSTIAAEARSRGARVFISTLSPTKPGRRNIPLGVIVTANDRLRVVARGEGAYLIDVFSALLPDLDGNIGSDGLHPTETGYRRIAETVFAAIRADLEIR